MIGKTRILIIDSDACFAERLGLHLENAGFEVLVASDARAGLRAAYRWHPEAILIDAGIPGIDGFEVCRRLRGLTDAAILMLSATGRDQDVVCGLDAGADDFVVKPCDLRLLRARLGACLRRSADSQKPPVLLTKRETLLMADPEHRLVFVSDGRSVHLTPREFDLLQYMLRNRGKVLSPLAILANVWGPEYSGEETLVKQFIHRLRAKLEPDPAVPEYIVTVRGSGYAFEEDTRPLRRSPGSLDQEIRVGGATRSISRPESLPLDESPSEM